MRSKALFFVGGIAAATALLASACSSTATNTVAPTSGTGQAVFGVTDAAADMGAVTGIQVTFDHARIHRQAGAWIDVSGQAQTFDLLQLHAQGITQVLGQIKLPAGSYDQVELSVSKVVVADASGPHDAKLPSNKLQFKGDLQVQPGATATATFDIIADQSLHMTGNGQYILAPVINLDFREKADAQVQSNRTLVITGGNATTTGQVGMDADGNVDRGLRITPDAALETDSSGKLRQTRGHQLVSGTVKSVDAAAGTLTITTTSGNVITVKFTGQTELRAKGNNAAASDLAAHAGKPVIVDIDAESKSASRVNVDADDNARTSFGSALRVNGAVKSVDAATGRVIITTPSGVEIITRIGSDGKLTVGGQSIGVDGRSAKVGDRIDADLRVNSGGASNSGTQGNSSTATDRGTLKAVDTATGKVILATSTGDLEIIVNTTTKLNVNGSGATLADLKAALGAAVTVQYDRQSKVVANLESSGQVRPTAVVTAVSTATPNTTPGAQPTLAPVSTTVSVNGKLKEVNLVTNTVILTLSGSADLTLTLNAQTKVTLRRADGTTALLTTRLGSEVSATYNAQTKVLLTLDLNN